MLEIFKLNNTGPTKKENLCAVCDQNGELLECHGVCQNYFHAACVDLTTSAEEFKCQECLSGKQVAAVFAVSICGDVDLVCNVLLHMLQATS